MNRTVGPNSKISTKAWADGQAQLSELRAERQAQVEQIQGRLPDTEAPSFWESAARGVGEFIGVVDSHATPEQLEAATAKVAELDAVMKPLENLAVALRQRTLKVETMSASRLNEAETGARSRLMDLRTLRSALAAAGPAVASYFPKAQLDALEDKLFDRLRSVSGEKTSRAREQRRAQLAELVQRREAAQAKSPPTPEVKRPAMDRGRRDPYYSRSATGERTAQAERTERPRYSWRREPPPIPESVLVKTTALADGAAATAKLAELLRDPEIGPAATAALERAEGPDRARLEGALKAFAALADFATGSPDYAKTGVSMWGAPKCKRSHQARDYGRDAASAEPRQADSRASLARALKTALADETPATATERALTSHFLSEIGVPARVAADWAPTAKAVAQALDDELFVPLRALNETIHMARSRAPRDAMVDAVREATQAVVEGRYADWKHTRPTSQRQIAHLDEAGQQTWLGTERLETKGRDGQTITTREAEGHEAFWATKVGGPSHAFDTMNWCILSLLGNARTKAVVVGDSDWHQNAGRAYLRLMKDSFDNPVVFLDNLEVDFPYRDHHGGRRSELAQAALDHALAKAKSLGAGLAVASEVHRLAKHDLRPTAFPGTMILEPSGMVVEAADTYGPGHDWDQRERMEVRTRAAFVSAEQVAAWNG